MKRLASVLNFLTCGVTLAAAVALYLSWRPSGPQELAAAAFGFAAAALSHVLVPVVAVIAVALTAAARFLDRPLPVDWRPAAYGLDETVSERGGIVMAPAVRPAPADQADGAPPAAPAPAGVRGEIEELRRRLEALLYGRGDTVVFVDELLAGAIRCRASDVHLQPRAGSTRLALRVDGEIREVTSVAEALHAPIVRRLKVLARLVVYKTDEPQDGHFTLETTSARVDVRLSVLPTRHGEKVALRLVRPGAGFLELERLGMDAATRAAFSELLREPQGLIVLTGPTGSGKTTTLYSALDHIHRTRGETTHIATIEDPVEIDLPFLSQTQVERRRGLDFATGLRAVLRQDPNVLMVGEIRDPETAQIAIQAGLTGHLILASLHAESTAGVFARLIDVGVEPFLVASSMLACVSQRLVRCLCPDCRVPANVSRDQLARLTPRGIAVDGRTFFRSAGCAACERSGVRGRTAIFELIRMTPALRRRVASRVPTQEIEALAREEGARPLLETAVAAAADGRISLGEALRVAA